MSNDAWPKLHREWVQALPAQLGPRKFRLLAGAWCRSLLEPAMEQEVAKDSCAAVLQREILLALEASDRFADTGKSKKALNESVKNLATFAWLPWPRTFPGNSLLVILLTKDPTVTLYQCAMCLMLAHKIPLEEFIPQLRQMVSDLAPAEEKDRSNDPGCQAPEVLELAQLIYRERQFQQMPELADALQRAGCQDSDALAHCRHEDALHLRGCWVLDWILGDQIAKPKVTVPARGTLKRYQLLGRELHATRAVTLDSLAQSDAMTRDRSAPGQPHQEFVRSMELNDCHIYAVLEHLGYGPIDDLPSRLHRGVDRALEYYFGDWWVGDEHDSRALDKSRPDRELAWLGVLPYALIFCGLTGRWDDAAKICSWFDASIQMEPRFELNDYEYQWLYLCIVSHLRPEPLEALDVEATLNAIRQCKSKRPRLLCAVWDAVLAEDQKAFDAASKASVRHFLAAHAENASNVNFWVALDESLMWLIAEKKGLKFSMLPEKLDAAVVRRQTIGLA